MAQTDMLRRYLDAGIAFTKMTQDRAEAIVRDLVGAGEVGADQASNAVQDLVERSRENTERLLETVRAEINAQIGNLGLATRDDIEALRREIAELRDDSSRRATTPASGGSTAPPPPVKKAPAKKASGVPDPGAKAAPAKAPAKKKQASAVSVPGTKAPATKAPAAKKATKNTAKKAAPAKRS
jgi:polyhydroxyalkanoate synthesis regulator phasin